MNDNSSLINVLDLGSSKVRALSARAGTDGKFEVLGMGIAACYGIQQGMIVDIKATEDAIDTAIRELEATLGRQVTNLYISSGGIHIGGRHSSGTAAIRDEEVSEEDMRAVFDAASAIAFTQDEQIMHIIPQSFSVNGQGNIRQPIGMSGVRLETNCYIVSGLANVLQNIRKCMASFNIKVERIIAEQIADSYGCLLSDEKESGVCLINLGAGTVKLIVIKNNAPLFMKTLPMGGANVTSDIATALKVPTGLAEEYKRHYGCVGSMHLAEDDIIKISRVDYRSELEISRQSLAGFISPRYVEIFDLINQALIAAELDKKINVGVVLTGGAARIEGLDAQAAEILNRSVRLATPNNIKQSSQEIIGDDASFVTASGIFGFALEQNMEQNMQPRDDFFKSYGGWGTSAVGAWIDRLNIRSKRK